MKHCVGGGDSGGGFSVDGGAYGSGRGGGGCVNSLQLSVNVRLQTSTQRGDN